MTKKELESNVKAYADFLNENGYSAVILLAETGKKGKNISSMYAGNRVDISSAIGAAYIDDPIFRQAVNIAKKFVKVYDSMRNGKENK